MDSKLVRIFKDNLKINMRSISVKTLLGDRNIKRINYKPYYQRNYIWDNHKASFFIESVMLGTDIPPLILFKSGRNIEVIDGRQRFETLKRYKENSFKLSTKGLKELKFLIGDKFNDLNSEIRDAFLDTKVRIFEFEVVNEPSLSTELEDQVKKEIFRRYNTGITPITGSELDNAKYDDDDVTSDIKSLLHEDSEFKKGIVKCFFKRKGNDISEAALTDFFRRFITLKSFPIRSYADSGRTDTRELLYDFLTSTVEDSTSFVNDFKEHVKLAISIHKEMESKNEDLADNKLIFECILWAITVLDLEGIKVKVSKDLISKIENHYENNISLYGKEGSHFYGNIIGRFTDTASFFEREFSCSLYVYLKDEGFSEKVQKLKPTESDSLNKISALKSLRLLKPEPSSEPVEEILMDLKTSKYLLRPSYQRQEKISVYKASAIIESILLGIYLPPIFIYKNENGVKEVIDGQQRILSVMAYLGKTYLDERGDENYSKNNNFSLKGLRILKELNGKKFSALSEELQDRILDFDINIIEIDHKLNEGFEPVDLFIRLNNKPYPIKENSFEMWNSTVSKDVIKEIRAVTDSSIDWFYLRVVSKASSRDRMENEEMVTVLSYLDYISKFEPETSGVEFFLKSDRLNCRISNKSGITNFLNNLGNSNKRLIDYIESINSTKVFIQKIKLLLNVEEENLVEEFNNLMNVKRIKGYSRSMQDIYLLWMCFNKLSDEQISINRDNLKSGYQNLIKRLKNVDEHDIDAAYAENFEKDLKKFVVSFTF